MPRAWVVALVGALVLVLGTVALVLPWSGKDRDAVTGTPVAPPFNRVTPIALAPGDRVCLDRVALDTDTARAVLTTAPTSPRSGPPLALSVTGPGYRSVATIAPGYGPFQGIVGTIRPPGRSLLVTFCVRNAGTRIARLGASDEQRTTSRPRTAVDGRRIRPQLTLTLDAARPRTIRHDLGTVLRHASAFKPWPFHRLLLGVLLVLVLVGLPAGMWLAMVSAAREDDEQDLQRRPSARHGW